MSDPLIHNIPLTLVDPSERNPRRKLERVDELGESLRAYGLLQPVVLRPMADGRYQLVAGHRRVAAALAVGWSTIPAIVRSADEEEAYLLALVENLQREDLSPREESRALETLIWERGWSTRQVASAVSRSQSYVSKRLRVYDDPVLGPLVLDRQLPVSTAEELLSAPSTRKRELAQRAVEQGWNQQAARRAIAGRFVTNRSRASIAASARGLRTILVRTPAFELTEADRRELRRLFSVMARLAQAPADQQEFILPDVVPSQARTA